MLCKVPLKTDGDFLKASANVNGSTELQLNSSGKASMEGSYTGERIASHPSLTHVLGWTGKRDL
jgi:hypothetical protein